MSPSDQGYFSISPLDGRYKSLVEDLATHFSEFALIKYRTQVEVEYLIAFLEQTKLQQISKKDLALLRSIYKKFSTKQADQVKKHEQKCHHDVKAVEYFLQDELESLDLSRLKPYLHFGLTSEDTNSLSYGLMLTVSTQQVLLPELKQTIMALIKLAQKNAQTVMMGRTHGQPAVPTTLGKELINFATRLEKVWHELNYLQIEGKCNGAVGNWNVHQLFFPRTDWPKFSQRFITNLGLVPNNVTNQILPADSYSQHFQNLVRLNQIMIDCCRDIWQYISDGYLKQITKSDEVGSSTMPQKVNPIDFENAEGNAGLATALLQHFTEKLPISRLQRDLSDSTVKRSVGTALGYTLLAIKSFQRGLTKVKANQQLMISEVQAHPEMMAEAAQSALRLDGQDDAYEKVKKLSRGKEFSEEVLLEISTQISDNKLRQVLSATSVEQYIGLASQVTQQEVKRINKSLRNKPKAR